MGQVHKSNRNHQQAVRKNELTVIEEASVVGRDPIRLPPAGESSVRSRR